MDLLITIRKFCIVTIWRGKDKNRNDWLAGEVQAEIGALGGQAMVNVVSSAQRTPPGASGWRSRRDLPVPVKGLMVMEPR